MVLNPLVAAATGFGATLILGAIVFAAAFLGAALVAGFAAFFWTGLALSFTVLVLGASTFAGVGPAASATAGAPGLAGLAAGSRVAASQAFSDLSIFVDIVHLLSVALPNLVVYGRF